jgi:hypothetical protein
MEFILAVRELAEAIAEERRYSYRSVVESLHDATEIEE